MVKTRVVENRKDRIELAHEAGFSKLSLGSVLAGVLVAYGAFAILAAIAGGVLNAFGVETETLSDNDWRQFGIATGIAAAVSLLLSYLFGGYVAGRMARRAGALNGLLVFVLSILLAAGVGAAIGSQADGDAITSNFRSIGVPTSGDEYMAIGTWAGIGSVLAMLLGSVLGGVFGERWHGKLLTRALDPSFGPLHERDGDRDRDRASEVSSSGLHFKTADERSGVMSSDGDGDAELDHPRRNIDIRNTDTTLDEDLAPEHSRTIRH